MIVVGFFNRVSPGCELSDEGLSRIGMKGSEFEFSESLDSLGVVYYL